MSKTDKTDPYWVKLHRYGVEDHNHRNGVCDYDPDEYLHDQTPTHWRWRCNTCSKAQAYHHYYDDNWFGQPKAVRHESKRQNRADRRQVKAAIHHERYDDLVKQGTGRNNAIWVCY